MLFRSRLATDYRQASDQLGQGPAQAAAQQFLSAAQATFWLGRSAQAWHRVPKLTGNKAILARIDMRDKLRTACDAAGLSFAGFSTESLDEHGIPAEVIDAASVRLRLAWRSADQDDSIDFYALGQMGLRPGLEAVRTEAQRLASALAERRKSKIYDPAKAATITQELEANLPSRPAGRSTARQPAKN